MGRTAAMTRKERDMATKTILIADDDLSLLEALKIRFQSEGFEVITSQDAYQALAIAQRDHPDLLLLDVNMPAGNGFSVHERLARMERLAGTPVRVVCCEISALMAT